MALEPHQAARERVIELAADARYRPFVIGYLLSCLDERHWLALVEAAIEFGEGVAARQAESIERGRELRANGG